MFTETKSESIAEREIAMETIDKVIIILKSVANLLCIFGGLVLVALNRPSFVTVVSYILIIFGTINLIVLIPEIQDTLKRK